MASLVESGVKNLNYGDADSVGFFQMRVGTWNQGPYQGFPDKPELQVKWFLDQAEAVKRQRMARGESVTDPHEYGNWIADIERPAEQYRSRYGERLDEAQSLLKQHAAAAPAPEPQGGAPAAAVVEAAPAAGHHPIDPAQFGAEGAGGTPDAEALALLHNKNVILDANGIADIKAGRIDPRVVGVLTKLSHEHKLTISCTCSDHPKFTTGGSVSNHHLGRGVDIAAIDGETVGPGSPLARSVASELSQLEPDIRPNEIGSPFAIAGPGYFTDAAHQNHIHIGFKQAIDPSWRPPADVAASAPVATAAAVTPGAPAVTPAAPAPRANPSQLFQKISATASSAKPKPRGDSQLFLKAVEPPKASAAQVQPAGAVQPVADIAAVVAGAPDAYPGDGAPREQIAAWLAGQAQ